MSTGFKEMKFLINGDEGLSEVVQKLLFAMGYTWLGNSTQVQRYAEHYLCTYDDGRITYGDNISSFNDNTGEEIDVTWMKPTTRETITVGDVVFDKAAFEKATKYLKPIN